MEVVSVGLMLVTPISDGAVERHVRKRTGVLETSASANSHERGGLNSLEWCRFVPVAQLD